MRMGSFLWPIFRFTAFCCAIGVTTPLAVAEHPCTRHLASITGFKSCPDVDRFRADPALNLARKKATYESIYHSLRTLGDTEIGYGCEEQQATKLEAMHRLDLDEQMIPRINHFADVLISQWNSLEPTQKTADFKVGLALEAERLVGRLEEIRQRDLDEIEEWLRRNTSASLTMLDADAAIRAAEAHMNLGVSRKFFDRGNLKSSYEDEVFGEVAPFKTTLRMVRHFSNQTADEARFELLVSRARTRDEGQLFLDGLTPFHARMVLLFHARNQMGRSPRSAAQADALAATLRLRTNLNMSEEDDNDSPFATTTRVQFNSTLFHDGFAQGAREFPRKGVLERLPKTRCGLGTSMPCHPTYSKPSVTRIPVGDRGYEVWDFLTEREVVASLLSDDDDFFSGKFGKLFERRLLCSEKDLRVGDIVVTDGELKIFLGYQEGPSGVEPIVVEAVGGSHRTVRKAKWQIYPPGSECKTSIFSSEESKVYYVLDIRNAPENLPKITREDLSL